MIFIEWQSEGSIYVVGDPHAMIMNQCQENMFMHLFAFVSRSKHCCNKCYTCIHIALKRCMHLWESGENKGWLLGRGIWRGRFVCNCKHLSARFFHDTFKCLIYLWRCFQRIHSKCVDFNHTNELQLFSVCSERKANTHHCTGLK